MTRRRAIAVLFLAGPLFAIEATPRGTGPSADDGTSLDALKVTARLDEIRINGNTKIACVAAGRQSA